MALTRYPGDQRDAQQTHLQQIVREVKQQTALELYIENKVKTMIANIHYQYFHSIFFSNKHIILLYSIKHIIFFFFKFSVDLEMLEILRLCVNK